LFDFSLLRSGRSRNHPCLWTRWCSRRHRRCTHRRRARRRSCWRSLRHRLFYNEKQRYHDDNYQDSDRCWIAFLLLCHFVFSPPFFKSI
jgi:hypothetical protein